MASSTLQTLSSERVIDAVYTSVRAAEAQPAHQQEIARNCSRFHIRARAITGVGNLELWGGRATLKEIFGIRG